MSKSLNVWHIIRGFHEKIVFANVYSFALRYKKKKFKRNLTCNPVIVIVREQCQNSRLNHERKKNPIIFCTAYYTHNWGILYVYTQYRRSYIQEYIGKFKMLSYVHGEYSMPAKLNFRKIKYNYFIIMFRNKLGSYSQWKITETQQHRKYLYHVKWTKR